MKKGRNTVVNDEERKLAELLAELIILIRNKGSRSEDVRKFVQKHKSVKEFEELAATCIFMAENVNRAKNLKKSPSHPTKEGGKR
jgi:hypothetical protein